MKSLRHRAPGVNDDDFVTAEIVQGLMRDLHRAASVRHPAPRLVRRDHWPAGPRVSDESVGTAVIVIAAILLVAALVLWECAYSV